MKKSLTFSELLSVSSLLFGFFFGAGNLIFPVWMGHLAGANVWPAIIGFLVTGVGIPLLGVAALGLSRAKDAAEMASRVHPKYGLFFSSALLLTIGPFFAAPRCGSVSYTVGILPLLGSSAGALHLAIFSLIFFLAVLFLSLNPGKVLFYIGQIVNPTFLIFLGVLLCAALTNPLNSVASVVPQGNYATMSFFTGFLEGYNTMDALAGMAFGVLVINVIKGLGITEPEDIALCTVKAGIGSCTLMGFIYIVLTLAGTESHGLFATATNGGDALALMARHYLGNVGGLILAVIVTSACLKTAVGLLSSCAQTFNDTFSGGNYYVRWVVFFCVFSFAVANLGLSQIIRLAIPVLMFLYPLVMTLILLCLFSGFFGHATSVYRWVTIFTVIAAFFDFLNALPAPLKDAAAVKSLVGLAHSYLPFFDLGMGWILPAVIGLVIGLLTNRQK